MVGGRVLDERGRIITAGEYFGFGGACGCPDAGRAGADAGYASHLWRQRSVSAVSSLLAVIDAAFLEDFMARRNRRCRSIQI